MPAAIAARGDPPLSLRPWILTVPESYGSTPNTACMTSDRPAPTSPANATISPERTEKEMSLKTPSRDRPSTSSTTSPGSTSCLGKSALRSRPTIRRIMSSTLRSATRSVATCLPSRMIVTRSHRAVTSSNRCEMNMIAAPSSRSDRTTAKSRSPSTAESAAVGSSMISTRASDESALAISTSCWSAIDRPRAGRPGSSGTPRRRNSRSALAVISLRSICRSRVSGWLPMAMFSATDRSGKSVGSW